MARDALDQAPGSELVHDLNNHLAVIMGFCAMLLEDLPTAAVQQAVVGLCRTSKWLPTVAEIRDAVRTLAAPPQLTGAEAWQAAIGWASNGSYGPKPPRDTLWGQCCYAIGLERMCLEPAKYLMPRFLELYRELADAERDRGRVVELAGPAPVERLTDARGRGGW